MNFTDREDAGKKLIPVLKRYAGNKDAVIIGLPRGGVVVADQIARELHIPLDILVVRKIGAPGNEEFAIGAIAEPDEFIKNESVSDIYDFSSPEIQVLVKQEKEEMKRRSQVYRGGKKHISLQDKIVILIDDGLATGTTMEIAVAAAKLQKPRKIIVAVPVSAKDTADRIEKLVDELIVLDKPALFYAVGQFYSDFAQTTDEEVIEIMSW